MLKDNGGIHDSFHGFGEIALFVAKMHGRSLKNEEKLQTMS